MMPVVGIVPLVDVERNSCWMLPGYTRAVELCGAIPVVLPLTCSREAISQLLRRLDGVILTGGQDIAPALYGEKPLPECGQTVPSLDGMGALLVKEALIQDKPFLGICRGLQFLNVALGGSLYQHIPLQLDGALRHSKGDEVSLPSHEVELLPDAPLACLLKKASIVTNSFHHQGIKRLAPSLLPMARTADGLTEAVYLPGKHFFWAVQWHPEMQYENAEQLKIFAAFVDACR